MVACEVLASRGDVNIEETEPLRVSLTPQGQGLIETGEWAVTDDRAVRTLSVPVARRELLHVSSVQPSERGDIVAFEWRWSMTDVGRELRAAGVRLQDWGLRIDDRHTFEGGATLTLVGDRWDIQITRPPGDRVD